MNIFTKTPKACPVIPGRLFLTMLLFAALTVSQGMGQSFDIANFQHTFIDPERNDRPILTEIYYPVDAESTSGEIAEGSFPLLVFGHGFVMVWSAYENLWTHFVPEGFVMVFPRTEGGFSPSHLDFGLDIAFLAQAIQEMSADASSVLHEGLNGKTAVMGHSMGGGASVLAAAENGYIHALLPLAPAETSPSAIAAAASVNLPTLIIAGSSDDVTPESTHQIPIYEALASESKSYVSITGGGHCYFANFNLNCFVGESGTSGNITITREEQQQCVNDLATPWLNYFLKDDCEAWLAFQDSLAISPRITGMQNSIIQDPEITLEGESLVSTPASTYQWYLNGSIIDEATGQSIIPGESGSYTVEVSYFNDCQYVSEPFHFTSDQNYMVEFVVVDQGGQGIPDAVVSLDGIENDPGDYVFENLQPGSYDYVVTYTCKAVAEGQIVISNSDLAEEVTLAGLPGDANGDGDINVLDVIAIVAFFTGTGTDLFCFENADVNHDGNIDVLDIIGIVNLFSQ